MYAIMNRIARLFALMGGVVLSALVIQTCLSIGGRVINSVLHGDALQALIPGVANAILATGIGPINGDFELVEAGMAFVIFAFLPLCHLNGAHASVDIFTARLPRRISAFLRMVVDVLFAVILVVIAWQFYLGTLSKLNSGQTTLLLEFPLWWAYAFSLTGAIATAVIAVYIGAARVAEVATGRVMLPADLEAGH